MKRMVLTIATLVFAGACYAQSEEKKPDQTRYYHLDFALKELEGGKVVNTRNYSMTIAEGPASNNNSSLRIGDKLPVPTGKDGQVTYVDVGVNLDCHLNRVVDNQMSVQVTAEIASVVGGGNLPLINQTRWSAGARVPLRKATTLFSADGASTKRQLQLELTATPIP